ncbi:hypothetical protein SASPL_148017 [Salvia splendens]|uniref:Gibberellin receptor GID1 n=1 Tax=Salvia splendens TaxID=180675 RepID=A0A8X8W8C6_SALSN|nr:hypothetical protein SASPL_148017 [Salvia splendens]
MEATKSKIVVHDVPPYLRVYHDGTIERLLGTGFAPASLHPETSLSARLYLPTTKLPLVLYFHGGAFCISSSADPLYHSMLNSLVSVDYRLAPSPPPTSTPGPPSSPSPPPPTPGSPNTPTSIESGRELGFGISGVLMVQPYFWGEEAIGAERENPMFKAVVDGWWRFVCPSDKGCDDPMINPFVDEAPGMDGSGCGGC